MSPGATFWEIPAFLLCVITLACSLPLRNSQATFPLLFPLNSHITQMFQSNSYVRLSPLVKAALLSPNGRQLCIWLTAEIPPAPSKHWRRSVLRVFIFTRMHRIKFAGRVQQSEARRLVTICPQYKVACAAKAITVLSETVALRAQKMLKDSIAPC